MDTTGGHAMINGRIFSRLPCHRRSCSKVGAQRLDPRMAVVINCGADPVAPIDSISSMLHGYVAHEAPTHRAPLHSTPLAPTTRAYRGRGSPPAALRYWCLQCTDLQNPPSLSWLAAPHAKTVREKLFWCRITTFRYYTPTAVRAGPRSAASGGADRGPYHGSGRPEARGMRPHPACTSPGSGDAGGGRRG